MSATGRLVLVATPIGHLDDLSARAKLELAEADEWIVEDTRVSGKLQSVLGLKKKMNVLNEGSTEGAVNRYADLVAKGGRIALMTDGGCPVISDPGAALVDACYERGLVVDALPGPSAVTTALALSGFFAQRFAFLGFLPRKPGPMAAELKPFETSPLTLVVFESPFRVAAFLEVASKALPERRYAVCREISKLHQQVFREKLPIIPTEAEVPRKGEFTIVIEGKRRKSD